MALSPAFQKIELSFAGTPGEEMATALNQELSVLTKADCGIGPVQLFLVDHVSASNLRERVRIKILVAGLQPRAFDMVSSGIFAKDSHHTVTSISI
jgi:hypothetical protein